MSDEVTSTVEAQACGNRKMSVPWRLWEITLCRMNNWGHAAFDAKELQMLVCGSVGDSEKHAVARGFKTLTDLGRISPDSTRLCVVVNYDMWRRGAGKGKWDDTCSEPSHRPHRRHVWSPVGGWKTVKREPATGTVTVHEPESGVPVYVPIADPWAAHV